MIKQIFNIIAVCLLAYSFIVSVMTRFEHPEWTETQLLIHCWPLGVLILCSYVIVRLTKAIK